MAVEVIEVFDAPTEVVEVLVAGPQGPEGPLQGVSYLLVTSAQTLEKDAKIAADTSGGAFTLTLPANPEAGDAIEFYDYAGTWNSNNLTIARNGEKIEGENQDLACNINEGYFTLVYSGETRGWQVLPNFGGGGGGESALTTQGDTLYRGASANQRLPIGTAGQVLKVNSGATAPEWGEAPATGVTSVSGTAPIASSGGTTPAISISAATTSAAGSMSAADKTKLDGIASGATANTASSATPSALGVAAAGTSADYARADHTHSAEVSDSAFRVLGSTDATKKVALEVDTNVPANTTVTLTAPSSGGTIALAGAAPSAHAASHAAAGSDPLAPSDIGAQSLFTSTNQIVSADVTLTSGRATRLRIENYDGVTYNITLPTTSNQVGDVLIVTTGTLVGPQTIRRENFSGNFTTLATISSGQSYRFITTGTTSGSWQVDVVSTHTHAASAITSGTLVHERGGLEADVSAYNGLVKISGGSTSAVTVTSAGEALLDDVDAAAQRTTLGLGTAATAATGDFAAASHTHELTALAATGATNGHVLTANGSNGATFAALPASGVTGAASSASDVLGVSGANITGVDANADRIVYWNNTSNKLAYGTPADAGAAAASHTHTSADINSQTASNGHVLTANGSGGASFAALPASGISAVGASTADVLSVSGSDLVADDGGTIDSADPFIKWDDTAGKLVYANPLTKPSGRFHVGLAPTTTSLGTNAVNIQPARSAAANVAAHLEGVAIGNNTRTTGNYGIVLGNIGSYAAASSVCIGSSAGNDGVDSVAIGDRAYTNVRGVSVGQLAGYNAYADASVAVGYSTYCGGVRAAAVGPELIGSLRSGFFTRPFNAIYWSGQTTTNAATVLNLDGTATNRFTIAASTALAVDILLVARRATTQDKWLVARRFLGIRRDGSNNTSLIGTVQEVAPDQSAGSPTWTYAITADTTNHALQLEVTGATGETVEWRATAFYRVA